MLFGIVTYLLSTSANNMLSEENAKVNDQKYKTTNSIEIIGALRYKKYDSPGFGLVGSLPWYYVLELQVERFCFDECSYVGAKNLEWSLIKEGNPENKASTISQELLDLIDSTIRIKGCFTRGCGEERIYFTPENTTFTCNEILSPSLPLTNIGFDNGRYILVESTDKSISDNNSI